MLKWRETEIKKIFKKRDDLKYTNDPIYVDEFIKKEQMRGADTVVWYQLEKYQRFSTPFSSFILVIIGFCVSFRGRRKIFAPIC